MARVSRRQQQHDRLESLGTMAAGLAHELNNPASAAKQAARDLAEVLFVLSETIGVFVESGVEREEASRLVALQQGAMERCQARTVLSSLETSDREDELGDVLTELEVPKPWELAATFAASGIEPAYLEEVGAVAGPLTVPVVRWIGASLAANQLAAELADSTTRMSDLVIAIKRLRTPRRAAGGRSARGYRDDAHAARAQAQAHDDRGRARLRLRAATRERVQLRARTGVDEPA
jgi:hypothetical protein